MDEFASRPLPDRRELDAVVQHARTALAALLRVPAGDEWNGYPKVVAQARALLGTLLDQRLALVTARMDVCDTAAVAIARADRDEAIAVTGALLYSLPPGDPAWSEVALTVGRLSYDRYRDPWPDAEPPDPDDLDAACDLLLRAASYEETDERTTLYLVLALGDRQRLMPSLSDAEALARWTRRLHAVSCDGGYGPYDLAYLAPVGSRLLRPWRPRSLILALG